MTIDWSKAPYDAEAGYCGTSQAYDAWYRRDGTGQVQQMCPAAGYPDWTWMGGRKDFPVGAELRPVDESRWNGEGLPPVGTVCEYQDCLGSWREVEITAIAKIGICFVHTSHDGENYAPQISARFRPIRTAEQIAAEERNSQILGLADELAGYQDRETGDKHIKLAEYLHDNGYRKQVTP